MDGVTLRNMELCGHKGCGQRLRWASVRLAGRSVSGQVGGYKGGGSQTPQTTDRGSQTTARRERQEWEEVV